MNGPSIGRSSTPSSHPTVFVSYSWDSDEHCAWVKALAERLRENGVEALLDKWELSFGADRTHFMEQVASSEFVLVICTPQYAMKGNERTGGAGYEAMLITGELSELTTTRKFIPVLRSGNWKTSVPIWLKTKVGPDLTGEPYSESEFNELLRTLHRQHEAAPPIGAIPMFGPLARNMVKEDGGDGLPIPHFLESTDDLNPKEVELLWNAAHDPTGEILHSRTLAGEDIRSNGRHFLLNTNTRQAAEWLGALRRLEGRGFIRPLGVDRDFYTVTDTGYAMADDLEGFARWETSSVILSRRYMSGDSETVRLACTGIVALPVRNLKDDVAADGAIMQSVDEPRSLLIEGLDLKQVPDWTPTEVEFTENVSDAPERFHVSGSTIVRPASLKLPLS